MADQDLFYGRTEQSRSLALAITALAGTSGNGLLALVGPSGSGKSSLLAAGILGQEINDGALAGWSGVGLTVGRLLAGDLPELSGAPGRRLVVVDQFEEALLLPVESKRQFMQALTGLAAAAVVVIGLRSDAFGLASLEPALEVAMSRPVLLPAMTREELREVILRPAEAWGVTVEDDLMRVLLEDVAPGAAANRVTPGALPLLSSAMLLTWAGSDGRHLRLADYRSAGGVASAVDRLAEQVYLSLEPAQQVAAERLFLRLVRVTGDVLFTETLPLDAVEPATRPAMEAFVAARMLTTFDGDLRISHQALLSHWRRLSDWLVEHRDDLAVMEKLRGAAQVWVDSGRDPAALIPVKSLAVFTEWLSSGAKQELLTDTERGFVAASEAHFASVLDEERATSRRLRRRGSIAIGMAAIGLALALVSGFLFLQGRGFQLEADQARREAQSRQIATTARELRSQDPNLQAQMSVLARRLAITTESTSAVIGATSLAVPTRWLGAPQAVLAVCPDGQLIARGDGTGQVTLWSAQELAAPGRTFAAAPGPISALAAARSGAALLLAVAGAGTARIWDVTGEPSLVADLTTGGADTTAVVFDRSGDVAAFATSTRQVRFWEAGSTRFRTTHIQLDPAAGTEAGLPTALAFDAGLLYVAGDAGRVARWRTGATPKRLPDLRFPRDLAGRAAQSLAVSPDGQGLAVGMAGKALLRWRIDGELVAPAKRITGFEDWVSAVGFSGDGRLLIAGGTDQLTHVFDAATGELLRTLPGPSAVTGAGFASDRPVTTDAGGTLRVWPAAEPIWRTSGSEMYNLSTDAAGEKWLAGGTLSDGIQLWRTDGQPRQLPGPDSGLPRGKQSGAVAVAPDGSYLLGATFDGRVLSWPLTDAGAEGTAAVVDVGLGYISFVQAAPDSRLVVAMGYVGTECVLLEADAEGRLKLLARIPTPNPQMVWFSADSRTLAVALPDRKVVLWDVSDPSAPREAGAVTGLDSTPISIAFAPRSARLAIGTESGQVSVWDVADPAAPARLRTFGDPHAAPNCVLFSQDENVLIAASGDERIWGWDLTQSDDTPEFALSGEMKRPWDVRFLTGGRMAVSGGNGALRVWEIDPEQARSHLCELRGEPLSPDEWGRYLPGIQVSDPCLPVR
ncbi:MAG: hypothetical protein IT193_00910 [Propionibacteriaceae bacterium]|nr:hypothetical protein [Propionibacteriaceae bacterium]